MTHQHDDIWQQVNAGQWYQTQHPQLVKARDAAKMLCDRLNQLPVTASARRQSILVQLFPNALEITTGTELGCDYGFNLYAAGQVTLGNRVVLLDAAPINLGRNVTIGDNVVIASLTHPLEAAKRKAGWQQASPVEIGDNVQIGDGCTVLPGAVIPKHHIIEPGTVVTRKPLY